MNSVYSYTRDDLVDYFLNIGEKKFKADQVFDWLYKKRVNDFDLMNNLNKKVISKLKEVFGIHSIVVCYKVSKFLDDITLESVNLLKSTIQE